MKTVKEYTDELEIKNKTLYEDKNYWKRLAEKRNYQLQQKENQLKEVRKYIESKKIYTNGGGEAFTLKNTWYGLELLGILDKVEE